MLSSLENPEVGNKYNQIYREKKRRKLYPHSHHHIITFVERSMVRHVVGCVVVIVNILVVSGNPVIISITFLVLVIIVIVVVLLVVVAVIKTVGKYLQNRKIVYLSTHKMRRVLRYTIHYEMILDGNIML